MAEGLIRRSINIRVSTLLYIIIGIGTRSCHFYKNLAWSIWVKLNISDLGPRRPHTLARERQLQQLRTEQIQVHQQLEAIYQAQHHHHHQHPVFGPHMMQCQQFHRAQGQQVHPDLPSFSDPNTFLQPPPDYVEFSLPAYEELFPNVHHIQKESSEEFTTTASSPSVIG